MSHGAGNVGSNQMNLVNISTTLFFGKNFENNIIFKY